MKKSFLLSAFLFLMTVSSFAQDITSGTWYNEEKTARVQFYENGGKLFGKIVWLKEPTRDGKPRTDELNPDKSKRNTPLMGLIFLKDFKPSGKNEWEGGTIYDPKSGKTYSSEMVLENSDKLNVRGYIGISLIGRTSVFTRATR